MKLERSDVEFAIWRKKVDKSLFEPNRTTIPDWACRMWSLQQLDGNITSRKDPKASASVTFKGLDVPQTHDGELIVPSARRGSSPLLTDCGNHHSFSSCYRSEAVPTGSECASAESYR